MLNIVIQVTDQHLEEVMIYILPIIVIKTLQVIQISIIHMIQKERQIQI